jgi:hypothetical protein
MNLQSAHYPRRTHATAVRCAVFRPSINGRESKFVCQCCGLVRFFLERSKQVCEVRRNLSARDDSLGWGVLRRGCGRAGWGVGRVVFCDVRFVLGRRCGRRRGDAGSRQRRWGPQGGGPSPTAAPGIALLALSCRASNVPGRCSKWSYATSIKWSLPYTTRWPMVLSLSILVEMRTYELKPNIRARWNRFSLGIL